MRFLSPIGVPPLLLLAAILAGCTTPPANPAPAGDEENLLSDDPLKKTPLTYLRPQDVLRFNNTGTWKATLVANASFTVSGNTFGANDDSESWWVLYAEGALEKPFGNDCARATDPIIFNYQVDAAKIPAGRYTVIYHKSEADTMGFLYFNYPMGGHFGGQTPPNWGREIPLDAIGTEAYLFKPAVNTGQNLPVLSQGSFKQDMESKGDSWLLTHFNFSANVAGNFEISSKITDAGGQVCAQYRDVGLIVPPAPVTRNAGFSLTLPKAGTSSWEGSYKADLMQGGGRAGEASVRVDGLLLKILPDEEPKPAKA